MTWTGALPRALAAARPPKPPPTITTRGVFDVCSSAPLIELRLASFINLFLKLLAPEIPENLELPSDTGEVPAKPVFAIQAAQMQHHTIQRGEVSPADQVCYGGYST